MTASVNTPVITETWSMANRRFLELELQRLRLALELRITWLRQFWGKDTLREYQGSLISDAHADHLLAGRNGTEEQRFYSEHDRARQVRQELVDVSERIAVLRVEMEAACGPPALDVLVRRFALTDFERWLLLVSCAPDLDAAFGRLYGYAQDDVNQRRATAQLACDLWKFTDAVPSLHDALQPEAPLVRYRILNTADVGMPLPSRALRTDDRIVHYLLGVNRIDERARQVMLPLPDCAVGAASDKMIDALAVWARSAAARRPALLLNLIGKPESGQSTIARAVYQRVGLEGCRIDLSRLPSDPNQRADMLALLSREALLRELGLYIEGDPGKSEDPAENATTRDCANRLLGFVIVSTPDRLACERDMLAIRVSRPDGADQLQLWTESTAASGNISRSFLERVVAQFDFGPEQIARIVSEAAERAQFRAVEGGTTTEDDVWSACREISGSGMKSLAQALTSTARWQDLVVPQDTEKVLRDIAAQVGLRTQVYRDWGWWNRLSRGSGVSALFSGPSGTGKTMAAEVLANDLNLDLYRIDLSSVVSKYIGETEKNLRRVFDAAEQSGALLFFDEADALFGKRTEVKDSHDRYANIEINYLLQRMEQYHGLAILATNMKSHLDQAFLRRLRFIVNFPFPDGTLRARLWRTVFPVETPVDALNHDYLARLELPGGNIKNIAVNASFLAAAEGSSVRMRHVLDAARREYMKMELIVPDEVLASAGWAK